LALAGLRACVVGDARDGEIRVDGGRWRRVAPPARRVGCQPDARGVILDSPGGQIYEGRGLARVIRERGLATYTLRECASACATAFLAGRERLLAPGARLGFHQYQSHTILPAFDLAAEQAKDRQLFEAQGIADEFLAQIFAARPQDMWWPTPAELIAGGAIHGVGFALGGDAP